VALLGIMALALLHGSDYSGIYARIDKVVLEPGGDSPDRIQVWGVFSLSRGEHGGDYQAPARGYLYFNLGNRPELARAEWNDLKQVAGTGQIVSFGLRGQLPRLRKPDEKPAAPDPYALNTGVAKVSARTDYPPVRAVADYRD